MMTVSIILILVAALFWGVFIYNRLIKLKNETANAFAQIDVQLKRRHDLIPNLIDVAKKYMQHERETLEAVIAARNRSSVAANIAKMDPGAPQLMAAMGSAEALMGGAMGRLMAVMEAYPELKADGTLSELSEELASTENRIGFARQGFNDAVLSYNNVAQQFPGNLVAGAFSFGARAPLQSTQTEREREAVRVAF